MAQLHRFVKLNDRFQSQVFTFIVPGTLAKDLTTDIYSRDFVYGHQKWCISLVPNERAVGAYLALRNVSDGMVCNIDFSFTMVNREHFTKNECIVERNIQFTKEKNTHGRKTFIGLGDLLNRGFLHHNDTYLLELELRSGSTLFEQVINQMCIFNSFLSIHLFLGLFLLKEYFKGVLVKEYGWYFRWT